MGLFRVIIESPFAGRHGAKCRCDDCAWDVARNRRYRDACMRDSLSKNEAPYASTKMYADGDVLDDTDPEQRARGIQAGLVWGECAELTAVYTDLGVSAGMDYGIANAIAMKRPFEYRQLPGWKE